MSDLGPSGIPRIPGPITPFPPPTGPPVWPTAPPVTLRRPPRWPLYVALATSLIAVVVGGIGWFRPVSHEDRPPTPAAQAFTQQETADAKNNICASYKLSKDEVADNTHRPNPGESDETRSIAVATNSRLAMYTAGDYLLNRLEAEPATPNDLAQMTRSLAYSYLDLAMHAMNNASASVLEPYAREIDSEIAKIDEQCR